MHDEGPVREAMDKMTQRVRELEARNATLEVAAAQKRKLLRTGTRGLERGQKAEVQGDRRARAQGSATLSATSTRLTALAAVWLLQARDHRFHPLQRFWLEKDFPLMSHIKNNLDNHHGQRHSVESWTVDARHNSSQ